MVETKKPECFGKYDHASGVTILRNCEKRPVADPCEYITRQVELSFPKTVMSEQVKEDNKFDNDSQWTPDQIKHLTKPVKQVGGDHYEKMDIEPWDVIDTWTIEQKIGWYRGNALKYLMRMGTKGSALEDAKKARHYIEKLVTVLESDKTEETSAVEHVYLPVHDGIIFTGWKCENCRKFITRTTDSMVHDCRRKNDA